MIIYPAIDLFDKKAVRLLRGDYGQMTVYNDSPAAQAKEFYQKGARHLHLVDLEGARSGGTPNLSVIRQIRQQTDMFIELGGGIRSMSVAKEYLSMGIDRIILGTAAVKDEDFLKAAAESFPGRVAVSVDVRDGYAAVDGWTENSSVTVYELCERLVQLKIKTVICTDISKDGAMQGAGYELYGSLKGRFDLDFIASGGVSSLEDVVRLKRAKMSGAIIGRAYYTGGIDLEKALEAAREE